MYCGGNSFTELDLPNTIEELCCRDGLLKKLDISNTRIHTLNCRHNRITELVLNECIKFIDCDINKLKYVDLSKTNIKHFIHKR